MPKFSKFNDERVLTAFVDNMITDKAIEGLSADDRMWLRKALKAKLDEDLERAIIMALPNAQLGKLNAMLDAETEPSDAEVDQLFEQSGVNFTAVSSRALKRFRDDYMARADDMEIVAQAKENYQKFLETAPSEWDAMQTPEGQKSLAEAAKQMGDYMTKSENINTISAPQALAER